MTPSGKPRRALEQRREQDHRREVEQAEHEGQRQPQDEVSVGEDARFQEGTIGREDVDDEHIEGEAGDERLEDDFDVVEPAEPLAPVEHELQGGDAERERDEAGPVEGRRVAPRPAAHEGRSAETRDHAHRHQQEEDPPPVVELGDIAAERRRDDRSDGHADAPDRECGAVAFAREDRHHDGLAHRNQRRAGEPLQDAEEDELLQALGEAATGGNQCEERDAPDHDIAPPDLFREPARGRRHDGRGDDVEGDDPGDFVLRCAEGALHLRQRHVGDRHRHRVERGGKRDRHQRQPALQLGIFGLNGSGRGRGDGIGHGHERLIRLQPDTRHAGRREKPA